MNAALVIFIVSGMRYFEKCLNAARQSRKKTDKTILK